MPLEILSVGVYPTTMIGIWKRLSHVRRERAVGLVIWLFFMLVYGAYTWQRMHFSQDAARDFIIIKQLLSQGVWLVDYGPKVSVANFYLPPLYYQIHLILTALFPTWHTVMVWLVIVASAFSPVILWRLLTPAIGKWLGLACALGYGFFYLVIVFGSQAWNPNLIPFLSLLFLYTWWKAINYPLQSSWIFGSWFTLVAAISLHYQAVVLIPFAVLLTLYSWFSNKSSKPLLLLAPLTSSILITPMVWAELSNNWHNTREILAFFTQEHTLYYERVSKIAYPLSYIPSFIDRLVLGTESPWLWFGRVIFFGGMLALGYGILFAKNRRHSLFILTFLLSVLLSLRLFKGDKLDYYLMTLFSMPALLIAALLQLKRSTSWIVLIVIAFIFYPTFASGFHHAQYPTVNGYHSLKEQMQFLEENIPTASFKPIFHDLNLANKYFFGVKELSELTFDDTSLITVDVCHTNDYWCEWQFPNQSPRKYPIGNELLLYLEKMHDIEGFQVLHVADFGDIKLVINEAATSTPVLRHPFNTTTNRTGSDYLIE